MFIAIDAGATYIRVANASSPNSTEFTQRSILSTKNNYEEDLTQITDSIHSLTNEPVKKIGIAVASVLNEEKNELIFANNIPAWTKKPLKQDLENEFKTEVIIENDVAAATLGESLVNTDSKSFLFISWGSGIGGAFAKHVDNKYEIMSSELGHQIVEINGRECSCGQNGCLETYCGGAFIKKFSGKMAKDLDQESWEEIEEKFSLGLTNLIAILLPEKITFAGGVALDNENRLEEIRKKISKTLKVYPLPEIEISKNRENFGLVGALSLLRD